MLLTKDKTRKNKFIYILIYVMCLALLMTRTRCSHITEARRKWIVLPISLENGLRLLRKTGIFQTLPLLHAHKLCAQTPKPSKIVVNYHCFLMFWDLALRQHGLFSRQDSKKSLRNVMVRGHMIDDHMEVHRLNERRYGVLLNSTLSFSGSSKGTVQLSIWSFDAAFGSSCF